MSDATSPPRVIPNEPTGSERNPHANVRFRVDRSDAAPPGGPTVVRRRGRHREMGRVAVTRGRGFRPVRAGSRCERRPGIVKRRAGESDEYAREHDETTSLGPRKPGRTALACSLRASTFPGWRDPSAKGRLGADCRQSFGHLLELLMPMVHNVNANNIILRLYSHSQRQLSHSTHDIAAFPVGFLHRNWYEM